MAIDFRNAGGLNQVGLIPYVGNQVTMSAYIRVNSLPSSAQQVLMRRGPLQLVASGPGGGSTYSFNLFTETTASPGNVRQVANKPAMAVGVVYHVIIVHDKDDPSRQFIAVNGGKTLTTAGSSSMNALNRQYYGGWGGVDFTIQRAFFLDGYAMTDEEIFTLADDVETAPGIFASAAAKPGVLSMYHSFEGPEGADVLTGEAGVAWGDQSYFRMVRAASAVNDSVKYAPQMTCISAASVQRAYVNSSGKSITVIMADWSGLSRLSPQTSSLIHAPTISIDGGPPVALPTTPATGVYAQSTADAVFIRFPDGVSVSPGQAVVLNAEAGWLDTSIGYCPEIRNLSLANYAKIPISKGLWPDARPIRVGSNSQLYSSTSSPACVINKNRALSASSANPRWPDGTIKGRVANQFFQNTGSRNGLDLCGSRGKAGLWVMRWDDYDPANPVTMSLSGYASVTAVEIPEYRNNGDSEGKGKARVFNVAFGSPTSYTLREAINATTTNIPFNGPVSWSFDYLTIGEELIKSGTLNASAKQFEGCTRGWNGTAATAHPSGTSFVGKLGALHGELSISINSPDSANTRYANFAIYEPGSWDVPATPGPVSLPPPDNYELDPSLKSYLEPGIGVWRYMDETPTQFLDVAEPEQFVTGDQPHFSVPKYSEKYHVAAVGPFSHLTSPYYYSQTPWPGAQKYVATLGASITTAPEKGTVETIKITDGRSTPILWGQQLFVGDETLRVVGIPLTGDDYQVERGALGTPTSAHPAGPITVGYRIPILGPNQYQPNDGLVHYYEVTFDPALSTPLSFGKSMNDQWAGTVDANISSRLSLKLTAPLDAVSLDLYVSPASPNDWDFIGKNLKIVIGTETLTAASFDRTAGKITVASRPSSPGSYSVGTPLSTYSGGVLLATADGARRAYNGIYNGRSYVFPTAVNKALVIGTGEAAYLGQRCTAVPGQVFDAPNAGTKEIVSPAARYSFEFTARMTGTAPGAWHWLNLPFRATDAAVYAAAKAVRDNLPPGRKVIVELSNEIWNSGFAQWATALMTSAICGLSLQRDSFILRSKSAFEVVKRCFAEVGRGDEVMLVICWQQQSEILADCRRLGVEPDAVAIAPYLHIPRSAAYASVFDAIDDDQVCDLFTFYLLYETPSERPRSVGRILQNSLAAHHLATGKRPKAFTYEGGLELVIANGTTPVNDPQKRRTRDIIYNPNWYFTELDSYAAMREILKVEMFTQYYIAAGASVSATNPATPNTFFWGMLRGVSQRPGYGDGRPGDVDNKLYSFMNPTDLLKGGDSYCRSTRMQAWLDHQKAYFANQDPSDPGTDPHDPDPSDPGTNPNPPSISFARPRRFVTSRFRPRFG